MNLDDVDWRDRTHFFALAARQMRRILVDSARARKYQKHGGGAVNVTLDDAFAVAERHPDLVALDDALSGLTAQDERKARVVELRFFGGLTNEEIAANASISTDTVTRDWQMAKLLAAPGARKGRSHLITDRWRRIESLCHMRRGRLRTAQRIWRKHAEATRRFAKKSSHWSPKATLTAHSLKCPLSVALFLRPSLVASLGHTASRHRSTRAEWARCITRRTRLNRNVAIKVLPPQWTADRQRRTVSSARRAP